MDQTQQLNHYLLIPVPKEKMVFISEIFLTLWQVQPHKSVFFLVICIGYFSNFPRFGHIKARDHFVLNPLL